MTATNHHIRNRHLPQGRFEGGIDEMNRILNPTDPVAVKDAGAAYEAAAKKFSDTLGVLRREVRNLVEHWGGSAAEHAVQQMELLYTSTRELSLRTSETGSSLIDHSAKLDWYKAHQPGKGFIPDVSRGDLEVGGGAALVTMSPMTGLAAGAAHHFMGENSEDKAAQEHMARLAGRTAEANEAVPESLSTEFPEVHEKGWPAPPPPPSRRSASPDFSGSTAHDPGGTGTSDPVAPSTPDPFAGGTDGPGSGGISSGTDGAGGGYPSDLVGSGGTGGGTDLAGLGGGASGGFGGGAGLGGGLGAGDGLGGAPNAVAMGVGLPSNAAGRGLPHAGRAGGKAGTGQPDVGDPPAGDADGEEGEEERERTTWLTEDKDVWSANDNVAPSVID